MPKKTIRECAQQFKKDPSEILTKLRLDFGDDMAVGDIITARTTPSSVPAGLTVANVTNHTDDRGILFDISGGTDKESYYVIFQVDTQNGDRLRARVRILVNAA